ncbi:MAG: aldo/keto reductase [Parvibaculum sp.]
METRQLGSLWPVSALTLGGGGLGQIWGETTREEAIATVHMAVERGITLLDLAPMYGRGESEQVVGAAFEGSWPDGIRVTTKCMIGEHYFGSIYERLETSLLRSLEALRRDHVDLFFSHSNICPDDYVYEGEADYQAFATIPLSIYENELVPAFEKLKVKGLIGDWGLTGTGLPRTIMDVMRGDQKPAVVQAITNLMDSPGGIRRYEEPAEPRNIIRTAKNNGVGVMGIRAVQAGALTNAIDRPMPEDDPDMLDFVKAAPYRALAAELGEDPAELAHAYALAMEGVDTLVLGVKNRAELEAALKIEARGPLDAEIIKRIEALGLRRQVPRIPLDAQI